MKAFFNAAVLSVLAASPALAQVNAGTIAPQADLPFTMTQVATFNRPWRIAFLTDGHMIVTEKVGPIWLVDEKGEKTAVANAPAVLYQGQGGMLGVFAAPQYAQNHQVYLTYSEPGEEQGTSSLALARATLAIGEGSASLDNLQVLWRDMPKGRGGQFGAQIAFSPDGRFLFLAVGDRQRMTPAQDPDQALGKILRLTLDGVAAPGNPNAGKTGASSVTLINPPRDTEVAKTAPVVSTYTFDKPNTIPSMIWTSGHRTPYGLAFAPDGRLWELEHGPRGGDELNLIEPGKNYGWPLVSYATNYNGVPIPSPDTRADLQKPVIYWTPVIAPGNLMFYKGNLFPQWKGSALISGIATRSLSRVTFDGKGGATPAERWSIGKPIRDVEEGPDGALWMLEDTPTGGLYKVTPK
jgi:aldose sugar dehydrogenase